MLFSRTKTSLVSAQDALPGRPDYAYPVPSTHEVNGHRIVPAFPSGLASAVFGLGCFWGAEKTFWNTAGVYSTAVGYAGGHTPYPTYDEVCSGLTGHTEAVLVVFDPEQVTYAQLLSTFFESHDPTQGMRQGNDVGTQYRSAIYYADEAQREQAEAAKTAYSAKLASVGMGPATTEVAAAGPFYYAEDYHQQYLEKNPFGYCPDHGTGVSCPVGLFATTS
ncbi:MAG: peptide-methionine (S)-S-oxide reductase MsrA [bacterium]